MINAKGISTRSKCILLSSIFILSFAGCQQAEKDQTKAQNNMTNIIHKNPETLFDPTPFAFSHSTSAPENGRYVFISGQSGGQDLKHSLSKDFRTQVQFALSNLETVLKAYYLKPDDVMKITILIVDHNEEKLAIWTEEMHKVWKNNKFPASTLIPVPRLALDDMLVEVDAIAFMQ